MATTHIAVPDAAFHRMLELLALSLDLVEALGVQGLHLLDGARAERLRQSVADAREESARIAEQALACRLTAAPGTPLVH